MTRWMTLESRGTGIKILDMPVRGYRFLLELVSDEELPARRIYLEPGSYMIGTGDEADVRLPVAGVSREHAHLEVLADGGVVLRDRGSKNGTFVDGRRSRLSAWARASIWRSGRSRLSSPPCPESGERSPLPEMLTKAALGKSRPSTLPPLRSR